MTQTPTKEIKAGRMMLLYLSEAAKASREHEGRRVEVIAALADSSVGAIYRFERGESWPKNLDQTVNAYAEMAGIEPIELWQRALNLWEKHGTKPLVGRRDEVRTSQRIVEQIRDAARRQAAAPARRESARTSTSTEKRRAAR